MNMANNNILKKLEKLEAKKNRLCKKIACISGSQATKLAQELDKIKNEINNIKESIGEGDGGNHPLNTVDEAESTIKTQDINLDKTDKEVNRYFVVWIFWLLFFIGIFLCSSIIYLRGHITSRMETPPIDCNNFNVIIDYPYALKLDEYETIHCVATPKNSDYQGKVTIEFMQNDRFSFEDDAKSYTFDFSQTRSLSSLPWTTKIKYDQTPSWKEQLSFLIRRKHIDFVLQNEKGEDFAKECISFRIISFYSVLVNITTSLILLTGTIVISFLRLDRFFKVLGKIILHYLEKRIK